MSDINSIKDSLEFAYNKFCVSKNFDKKIKSATISIRMRTEDFKILQKSFKDTKEAHWHFIDLPKSFFSEFEQEVKIEEFIVHKSNYDEGIKNCP